MYLVGVSETDKYTSHDRCSLQDFGKLYKRLIAYLIFEIDFNTQCYCLKIDFEDFSQTVAILKISYWLLCTMF